MTPIDQQSTALLYGFCARTSGAVETELFNRNGDETHSEGDLVNIVQNTVQIVMLYLEKIQNLSP